MDGLNEDVLFLAITRPTMKWGVPWKGWLANFFGSMFASMLIAHNPFFFMLAFPIIHLVMRGKTSRDHNFFREMSLAFDTMTRAAGAGDFGGSTLNSLPARFQSAPTEMIASV